MAGRQLLVQTSSLYHQHIHWMAEQYVFQGIFAGALLMFGLGFPGHCTPVNCPCTRENVVQLRPGSAAEFQASVRCSVCLDEAEVISSEVIVQWARDETLYNLVGY